MGHLRIIVESVIITSFSLFLFIAPFSRRWGKYFLICSLILAIAFRFLTCKRRLSTAFAIGPSARIPLAVCVLSCLASIIFSQDPYQSQKIFVSRYLYFFVAAWAGFIAGRDFLRPAINIFAYAMAAISMYMAAGGMRDYAIMSILEPRLWTIWGRYTSFNMLPLYLVFFMCFNYAYLAFWNTRNFLRWPALINVFMFIPVIIWQQCRSAYPAMAGGVVCISFFRHKKVFFAVLAVLAVIAGTLAIVSEPFRGQILEYADMEKWDNRLPLFHSSLDMFRDHPVTGVGIGMFENLIRTPLYEPPPDYMPQYRDFFIHAHNFYLETLAEMGLLGIAAFSVLFFLFFRQLAAKIRATGDSDMRPLCAGFGSIIAVYLIFGITLSVITVGLNESAMFWLFFGFTWGLIKRKESHGRNARQSC